MKLTSVEIRPDSSSEVAVLSFRDPNANNKYNVKSIAGLDADEIVPRSYGGSGSFRFYNLTLQKRTVVFKIGLNPSFVDRKSYSELRDDLYRIISASRTGKMSIWFKNGTNVKAALNGFVSKFNNTLFEKTQEVEITVVCDEPLLRAPDPTEFTGLNPIHSILEIEDSTAPHGFSFNTEITAPIASLKITDPNDDTWNFEVVPSGGFLTGDKLYFSSEYNDKKLYIVRSSVNIYLADVIVPGSVWPILFPGVNQISFTHPESLDWDTISYYPAYWGV